MIKISVLIPAYSRPDDLRTTLAKMSVQNYRDYEIVVIDDGTPDRSIVDTVAAFPGVRYARPLQNLGLIGARNFGAKLCKGELILNLDDDSWLVNADGLQQVAEFMDANPKVGVAALNIGLASCGYLWDPETKSSPLRHYTGCGNVYRHSVLDLVGDYVEDFRRQGEESERTLRVIDAGYEVVSVPQICVFHAVSPINREMRKHLAYEAANYMRRELLRAPLPFLPLGVMRAVRFAFRHRREMDTALYRRELLGKRVPLVPLVRRHRKPVTAKTYIKWLMLGVSDKNVDTGSNVN